VTFGSAFTFVDFLEAMKIWEQPLDIRIAAAKQRLLYELLEHGRLAPEEAFVAYANRRDPAPYGVDPVPAAHVDPKGSRPASFTDSSGAWHSTAFGCRRR
jgi:hypothetical protein